MSRAALGADFGKLFTAAISSNLADGIGRLAIPLTAVALTQDPLAIGLLTALTYVPWLVFGIPSGMIVDRIDRRTAMAIANTARMLTAALVAVSIATGTVTIAILAAATLVLGLGETLFDNATNAVVPSLVPRSKFGAANGRIQAAQVGVDMFVATPLSGLLYAVAVALPMIVSGAGYVVAVLLVLALPVAAARPAVDPDNNAPILLREAMQYLWSHRYLRSVTLLTTVIGAAIALAQSVTVLVFVEHFGVTEGAIGFVTAGIGIGGLSGSLLAGRFMRRFGFGRTLVGGSVLGGVGLCVVGLAPWLWVAMVGYAVSAFGISTWNVPWATLRQILIPDRILGRVVGAIRTITWFFMPLATMLGAWIAKVTLPAPFVVGGAVALVVSLAGAGLLMRADAEVAKVTEVDSAGESGDATAGSGPDSGSGVGDAVEAGSSSPTRD